MEEGRLLISADIAANTHTSTCQKGCEDGQSLIRPSEEAVGALPDPTPKILYKKQPPASGTTQILTIHHPEVYFKEALGV